MEHPACEPEDVLGAEEQFRTRLTPALEAKPRCELACRLQRLVLLDLGAADGDRLHARGNSLENGGLAGPVFTDEERDRRRELQRIQRRQHRNGPRKPAAFMRSLSPECGEIHLRIVFRVGCTYEGESEVGETGE